MGRITDFMAYSSIALALDAPAVAFICMALLQIPFRWEPLAISFCAALFLYNLNRHTDAEEDTLNCPERLKFIKKKGKAILTVSAALFILSLALAFMNSPATFAIALSPFALVFSYSVLRAKRLFLLKNIIVAAGWAMIAFLVLSYSQLPLQEYFGLAAMSVLLLFFARTLIDSIASDMHDIEGDRKARVKTMANIWGIRRTRAFFHILNIALLSSLLFAWVFLVPMPFLAYIALLWTSACIFLLCAINPKEISETPSGRLMFFLDNETVLLALVLLAIQVY